LKAVLRYRTRKKIQILKTSEYTFIISEVGLRVWKSEILCRNRGCWHPCSFRRDSPLFTIKSLIKFKKILRNIYSSCCTTYRVKYPTFCHIKYNNSEMAKVKTVKNERDPPLFTGMLLIKFQNILRNTSQVIIRHRVKILFSIISSPITLERQKWKLSKLKGILLSSSVNRW
jgi:hypothetical protein